MILMAFIVWIIDVRGWRFGTGFFKVFGANPLFAFVFSEALAQVLCTIEWFSCFYAGWYAVGYMSGKYLSGFRGIYPACYGGLMKS